jgi:tRNA A37 threonylcarbamoyladenosine modification protein TsaB
LQAPESATHVDVLADAQQDKVYVQSFARDTGSWRPLTPLAIRPFADWLAAREPGAWITGPGLRKWRERLPANAPLVDANQWEPQPRSLLRLGLARYAAGERDDPWTLEPLYLRPSSAEEQWKARPSSSPRTS